MKKNSQAEFLQRTWTLIENASGMPELASVLVEYGYDEACFAVGKKLWKEANALAKRKDADYGSQYEATKELNEAWRVAATAYGKTLRIARVAYASDSKAYGTLRLMGPRKQTLAGWYEQAGTLYENLANDPQLAEKLVRFGYTEQKLAAERELVETVKLKSRYKTHGTGAAQLATAERDEKLRELDAWVSELLTVCRVAFYGHPQELEKLGVMAQTSWHRGKPAGSSPAA